MDTIPTFREWSGRTIQDRVGLVNLQVYNSLRPEVESMAHQMLDEAGCPSGDPVKAAAALFWGFRNRYRYLHDPWELDLFSNAYRAWLVGGGSPDGDLSSGGVWFEDCDGADICLLALAFATMHRTGIQRVGSKVIGPAREPVHIYAGIDVGGRIIYLDPTVASFGPGNQAPERYQRYKRFFLFDVEEAQRAAAKHAPSLSALGDVFQAPTLQDVDRSSPRNRVDGLVRRVYRSLRDPVTRISAITMLREAGCPARDDFCDAAAILNGVQKRYRSTGPIGGSVRTLGQFADAIVNDSAQALAGDDDDVAMAVCALTLSIGFRSGVRVLPNGQMISIVQMPRAIKGPHRALDLRLDTDRPVYGSGGTLKWYQERH